MAEARHLLRPGGRLVNVNMDPPARRGRWNVYDYFPARWRLTRGVSRPARLGWIGRRRRVSRATWLTAEHSASQLRGQAVLAGSFLQRGGSSQLARLRRTLDAAGAASTEPQLPFEIWFSAIVAQAPGS